MYLQIKTIIETITHSIKDREREENAADSRKTVQNMSDKQI